ncbi:MAG: nucleotidyltransferase family protein [Ruminococcus sp.]|nr:nucleotidyltransferase family protein [Ruminococcus sp.]
MKVSGIVCEYNPFHNGHLYHISETRRCGATHIAAVMSGSFVQRGDTAIMDKHRRARLAVKSGADLVIELPVQYCLSPAESFASGAVWLLGNLCAVDELSFGSECGDTALLSQTLDIIQRTADEKGDEIRRIMEKGYTYPKALSSVIRGTDHRLADVMSTPNNTLAIEYMRALRAFRFPMDTFTVTRKDSAHDGQPDTADRAADSRTGGRIASAAYIREKLLSDSDIIYPEDFMPEHCARAVYDAADSGQTADIRRLERVILYKVRTSTPEEIARISDVGQGLENRIYAARMSSSLSELLERVKTKRYTMARIRRILLSLLIGITREDMTHLPPYGRILAFNDRGAEILARAKGKARIPYGTSLAKLGQANPAARRFAELEERASDIYGLALGSTASAQEDLRARITIDLE